MTTLLLRKRVLDIVILWQDEDSMKAQDDVRRKSYNEPTLEDKFDKSQMPKPMQVRELWHQRFAYGILWYLLCII